MRGNILLWLFFIPFYIINSLPNTSFVNASCLGNQHSLLLNLKTNLIFNPSKSKRLVFWNQSEDCCQWNGVKCNEGHVIALDLSEESISGGLNDSSPLYSLQHLQSLNLAFNNFSSVIPSEMQKLKNLRYLNLSMAGFQGQIPQEISNLRRLVILDLSSSFTSHRRLTLENPNIAMLLQNLTDITELYLDGVAISSKGKEWCHALSSLQELHVISMSLCNLSGPIDSSLSKLSSLSNLILSHNNISSMVPEFFANFSNLSTLELSNCGLSGSFPKNIFEIPTLKVIDLSDNQYLGGSFPNFPPNGSLENLILRNTSFSGQVPNTISNMKKLSTVDLSYCQFNGTLPSSMSKLTQLIHVDLSSNNFSGPLPSFNMSNNLTYLSLFHNHLNGVVPSNHFEGLKNLVSIDLGFNLFSGSLPSSLFKLPRLLELRLNYNKFSGLLDEFVSSPSLEMLDLGGNNLEGPIPLSLFNLRTLQFIQLSSNKFNGTIKLDLIRRLSNLTALGLSHNSLSIDINYKDDLDLSPFPNLSNLMLAFCKLRGFPSFLKNQSTLLYLDLAGNEIGGPIPEWIWQLESVMHLNLSKNFLTNLEGNFGNSTLNLFLVDLSFNQLQGPIPFIPKFVNYLDYSHNRFSSIIPPDIGNRLPFATIFSLSNNNFQGEIPESFCNASSLHLLDLSYNNLVGTIPNCFTTLSNNLRVLNFGGNKLHGHIPNTFQASCSLKLLDLNDNLFEGTIPKSLVNCQKLQVINLAKNMLIDKLPCFFSNISTLRIMDLKSNKLHGSIECPKNTGNWEMLHIVDLASNSFSGAIPGALLCSWKAMMDDDIWSELGHLFLDVVDQYDPRNFKDVVSHLNKYIATKLAKLVTNIPRFILDQGSSDAYAVDLSRYQSSIVIINKGQQMKLVKIQRAFSYVDLSSNYFEGAIPNELMQLKALNALNLSHNALLGHIPSSIGNLRNLESLDLSMNSLNGKIPTELGSLSFLAYLNLSFNHLEGEIPMGTQIQSFDANSFKGNDELCGPPLTHNCIDDEVHGASKTLHSHSSIDWNFLSVELGFIFGFGIFIIPLILWRTWRLWYSKCADEMLFTIIPQLDFVYEHHGGQRYKTLRWRK